MKGNINSYICVRNECGFKLPKRSDNRIKYRMNLTQRNIIGKNLCYLDSPALYCHVKLPANSIEKLLKLPDERLR